MIQKPHFPKLFPAILILALVFNVSAACLLLDSRRASPTTSARATPILATEPSAGVAAGNTASALASATAAAAPPEASAEATAGVTIVPGSNPPEFIPLAAAGWPVKRQDGFDDNRGGWMQGHDSGPLGAFDTTLEGGLYHWDITTPNGVLVKQIPSSDAIGNLFMAVDLHNENNSADTSAGMVLRLADNEKFYYLALYNGGNLVFWHVSGADWQTLLNQNVAGFLNPGGTDRLSVLAMGPHFAFWLNGQLAGEVEDGSYPQGPAGLAAGVLGKDAHATIDFDNLVLHLPAFSSAAVVVPTRAVTPRAALPGNEELCGAAFSSPASAQAGPATGPVLFFFYHNYYETPQWERYPFINTIEAASPSDVRTLVCVFSNATLVGSYTDGAGAMRVDWEIRLVDKATGQVLAMRQFTGGDPPDEKVQDYKPGYGPGPEYEIVEQWLLSILQDPSILPHGSGLGRVVFSPDGKLLASAAGEQVWLWQVSSGQKLHQLNGHQGVVTGLAFAPGGTLLASSSADGTLKLWDPATGQAGLTLTGHTGAAQAVAFAPDGKFLASGGEDGAIKLWDPSGGQELRTLRDQGPAVTSLAFAPDGTLASGDLGMAVELWDPASGDGLQAFTGHRDIICDLAFSPDGTRLASAGGPKDRRVIVWDVAAGEEMIDFYANGQMTSLAFSPDGKTLAAAVLYDGVQMWDAQTGTELPGFATRAGPGGGLAFSSDGARLAIASSEGMVKLWTLPAGTASTTTPPVLRLSGHTGGVTAVAFSPPGEILASASWDSTIILWDAATGKMMRTLNGHLDAIFGLSFSPDGRLLASGSRDNSAVLWDVGSGQKVAMYLGHTGWVNRVAFSPDGSLLATAGSDARVKVWNVSTGQEVASFDTSNEADALAFSPDGRFIAWAGYNYKMVFLNTATCFLTYSISTQRNRVYSLAFSPDGQTLASGAWDNTAMLWEAPSGLLLRTLEWHQGLVHTVAFSPDGSMLASGGEDRAARLWDPTNGGEVATFMADTAINSLAFSPDGLWLAAGCDDSQVWLWAVP